MPRQHRLTNAQPITNALKGFDTMLTNCAHFVAVASPAIRNKANRITNVTFTRFEPQHVEATVRTPEGSEYHIRLIPGDDRAKCSCPFATRNHDKVCNHLVAIAMKVSDRVAE